MNKPVISVNDVCFAYNEREVLHNVSFEVAPHAFVAVVGPNGGGKTTLLKLLMGGLNPRYGTLQILGSTPQAARSRIGYVPQYTPFDAHFPLFVRDAVLMGRVGIAPLGLYRRTDRLRVKQVLEQVGLEGFEHRSFAKLSGGERQRVLIAQALVAEAELLLLDEPVANVDPDQSGRLYALFKELTKTVTVLMVSHHLGVVTSHATHVLCVNGTAELHAIGEVASETFTAAYGGGALTAIQHRTACHVIDASTAMHQPHRGHASESSLGGQERRS